ncbi:ABC transporter ATP-binding protein [Enterovirga sp. CN4-39]|uniref:ABC transporter ATP-binding protein n=1 Tax=Enterovirga sp. CN4-39 TaxID=3400910 RepID=UPI003BFEC868
MSALIARRASKRFGGLVALDDVSLDLQPGEVHGLIGPNGSGKTTMLNLMSGYYRPDGGEILLGAEALSGHSVQRRPNLGIARTFQKPRLLPTLTVLDNAMLGAWRDVRSDFITTALSLPKALREEREIRRRAEELVHGVGLGHAINRRANLLEHAEQRFLEIARALALRPRFLLLDEPAGGLTGAEIEHLGRIIATIRDAGIGVLLVEHHTDFVFRICSRVTTLDRGRLIKHGTPDEVRTDAEVVRVYLGA